MSSSGRFLSKMFIYFKLLNSPFIVKVIFITNELKKFIQKKYKYKKKNFLVLPDATDVNHSIKANSKKKAKKKIGYFGSIYKSRGIDLIKQLAELDKKNIYYIYGGSKNEVSELKKFSTKNLIIHGQIPFKRVKKKIIEMDILLMPYTKKATFSGNYGNIINFMSPMKMFDYLGAGKLIISSNIKVLREILTDNYNSILIKDYLNVLEWKKIDKINLNSNFSKKLRLNAIKTAKLYNWKNRAKKMIS